MGGHLNPAAALCRRTGAGVTPDLFHWVENLRRGSYIAP